jgi:hypothetical protein
MVNNRATAQQPSKADHIFPEFKINQGDGKTVPFFVG